MVNPTRSLGDVPDAVIADDTVGAVLEVDDDRNLKGAFGVDEVDKRVIKHRLLQLQEYCHVRNCNDPANVLEVFTFVTKRVEEPVVSVSEAIKVDAANARVTMTDALQRAREETGNANAELPNITKAQE